MEMIPAAVVLYKLNKLLSNIKLNIIDFRSELVTPTGAAIAAVMIYWRILAFTLTVSFAFIGLLLRVLKNVFEQAVIIREENDLTV